MFLIVPKIEDIKESNNCQIEKEQSEAAAGNSASLGNNIIINSDDKASSLEHKDENTGPNTAIRDKKPSTESNKDLNNLISSTWNNAIVIPFVASFCVYGVVCFAHNVYDMFCGVSKCV